VKYCIIRKVPFKWPGTTRIVWAHVLAGNEGFFLVLVPKTKSNLPHSIFIAHENIADRVFESIGPFRFDLETEDVTEAGDKLRMLGKSLSHEDYLRLFGRDDPDDFP
jgi:hypothetical protein